MNSSAQKQRTPGKPGAAARLRLLGKTQPVFAVDGHVSTRDGKILCLLADCPLPAGSAVRIDVDGGIVLGEVGSSEQSVGRCLVAVIIDQVIPSVSELASLIEHVMSESRPPSVTRDIPTAG